MKEFDLEKTLKAARVPDRPQEYWETFPGDVLARLRTTPKIRHTGHRWRPQLAWGFGVAFACLAIGFAIGHWHAGRQTADPYALLQNEKVLREVLALFPNRVRAIVQDEHGLQLVLSDTADVPVSTPLWVKICDGPHCRAAVTFSGQSLDIAGERVEILANAEGDVMLVGDRLVWSSKGTGTSTNQWQIQARILASL
jgi:hypothetical protein